MRWSDSHHSSRDDTLLSLSIVNRSSLRKESPMKSISLATLVLLLLTAAVVPQENKTSSGPPDLIVLEKSWSKKPEAPSRVSNPLGPNEALINQTRVEKAAIRQRDDYSLPNQPTEARMPIPSARPIPPPPSAITTYVYKIKVKNAGPKTIKSVDWEYQFLDPQTQAVLGYRRIKNETKIFPGHTKVLEKRFTRQPTILVNVNTLGKKYQDQFTERLIIHRIQYSDGSIWQRPATK